MSWLSRYCAHPCAEARAVNQVAMVVGGNGPFYPLYVLWLVPEAIGPALLTLLATPIFLAVPAISRISPRTARLTLVLTGLVNILWCTAVLGPQSGVGLFVLPCLILAGFSGHERREVLGLLGLGLIVVQAAYRWPWPTLSGLAPDRQSALYPMNLSSTATFLAYLCLVAPALRAGGTER